MKQLLLVLSCLCPFLTFGQKIGFELIGGYILNHSHRADYHIGIENDNYNTSPIYGINIIYQTGTNAYQLGFNTTNFINEFNLNGDPIFYYSDFKYLTKFRTFNYSIGMTKDLVSLSKFNMKIENGVDLSYANFNNYTKYFKSIDSIFYNQNEAQITYTEHLNYLIEISFGFFVGIKSEYYLNDATSINLKLFGRFGLRQKFQSDIVFQYDDDKANFHPAAATIYIMNKGDYLGFNLGLSYYFNLKKEKKKNDIILRKKNRKIK